MQAVQPSNINRAEKELDLANPFEKIALSSLMKWVLATDQWAAQEFSLESNQNYLSFVVWFFTYAPGVQYNLSEANEEILWANSCWPENTPAGSKSYPITRLMRFIWLSRIDLQSSFAIAGCAGRREFSKWFLAHGLKEHTLDAVLIPAWLRLQNASPLRQFLGSLRKKLEKAFSAAPGSNQPEMRQAKKKAEEFARIQVRRSTAMGSAAESFQGRVNLVGPLTGALSQGEHCRNVLESLQAANEDTLLVDVILPGRTETAPDEIEASDLPNPQLAKINLFGFNPDWLLSMPRNQCLSLHSDRYNISYGFWELNLFHERWLLLASLFDEIWAPTTFIYENWLRSAQSHVIHMPIAVGVDEIQGVTRADYRLPKDKYLFLFNFDSMSHFQRKNPFAVIEAFQRAFPDFSEAGLVIKMHSFVSSLALGINQAEDLERLQKLILDDKRIIMIDEYFSRAKMTGLMQVCDAYISLHRAEGFGLGLAESMLLAKPVIATNYSGNLDFTLSSNSCLVDHELIPVKESDYLYFKEGQTWADADVEHAAWHMRRLVDDQNYGKQLGIRARDFIYEHHNFEKIGLRYSQRLAEIALINR